MLTEDLYNKWIQIYPYMKDYLKLTPTGDIDVYMCKNTVDYKYLLLSILDSVGEVVCLNAMGVFFNKNYGPSLDGFKDIKTKRLDAHDLDGAWAFIEGIIPSIDSVIDWYKKAVIDRNVVSTLSHLNFNQAREGSLIWRFYIDDPYKYVYMQIYLPSTRRLCFTCKITINDNVETGRSFLTFDELMTWLTAEV